jgi:hypothetical protein
LKRANASLMRQAALQRHRLRPFAVAAELVEPHAWRGMMQAGPAIQPTPPISMTAAGMCAEAENTLMASPQRS